MSAGLWGFRPRADRGVLARPGGERTVAERRGETQGVNLGVQKCEERRRGRMEGTHM